MRFELQKKMIEQYSTKGGGGYRGHVDTAVVAADDEAHEVCRAFDGQEFRARAWVVRKVSGGRGFYAVGRWTEESRYLVRVEGVGAALLVKRYASSGTGLEDGQEINVVVAIIGSRLSASFGRKDGLESWEDLLSLFSA